MATREISLSFKLLRTKLVPGSTPARTAARTSSFQAFPGAGIRFDLKLWQAFHASEAERRAKLPAVAVRRAIRMSTTSQPRVKAWSSEA